MEEEGLNTEYTECTEGRQATDWYGSVFRSSFSVHSVYSVFNHPFLPSPFRAAYLSY
jgi:hypothetical protein